MKKVQNGTAQGGALDELCKRSDSRTRTFDRSPEYARQRSRELTSGSSVSRSYKLSAGDASALRRFKNGVAGERAYMTERDFASYFKATREYTPESNVELDSIVFLEKTDAEGGTRKSGKPISRSEKQSVKAQLLSEANRANPKTLDRAVVERVASGASRKSTSSDLKRVAKEAAKTWIPLEERHEERIVRGSPTKLPGDVILAIFVITVSLLLIVGSAVLLGSARQEQNELESMIAKRDAEISELQAELDRKNESADIEIYADENGMISKDHISVEYINSNKEDGVEKSDGEGFSLSTLLKWFFANLK